MPAINTAPATPSSTPCLEPAPQPNLIQLRDHLKLLSLLASPRFRKDEHHSLPIPLQPLSDCFASLAGEADHVIDQLHWRSGKPDVASANDA